MGREKAQFAALKASMDDEEEERERSAKDGSSGGAGRENYKLKAKGIQFVGLCCLVRAHVQVCTPLVCMKIVPY